MYNKKMLINLFNDCMFVCQRLYQISQRGIWADVREAGQSVLDRITGDILPGSIDPRLLVRRKVGNPEIALH